MAIELTQWEGSTVTPTADRIIYDNNFNGIIHGCSVTHIGANKLRIGQGYVKICGGLVAIEQTDVECEVSTSGTLKGQIWIRLDLDSIVPIRFMTEATNTLTTLTKNSNANFENGVYELQLATYSVNESTISNLVVNDLSYTNYYSLPVNGWTASAPYTQTVRCPRITSNSQPIISMGAPASPSASTYKAMNKAYGYIDRVVSGDGTLTFYCYNKRPTSAISIIVKGA